MHARRFRHWLFAITLVAIVMSGCLGEPEIEDRWTLVEFLDTTPAQDQAVSGASVPVRVNGRITYRRIVTGFLVAEVRYSPTIAPQTLVLNPDEPSEQCAANVDRILANSVTAGRATRAVTGFDHLMQDIDLSFDAMIPDTIASGGVYLVLYLGSGEEIELESGEDSLVVTPFVSTQSEILHTGFAIDVTP